MAETVSVAVTIGVDKARENWNTCMSLYRLFKNNLTEGPQTSLNLHVSFWNFNEKLKGKK